MKSNNIFLRLIAVLLTIIMILSFNAACSGEGELSPLATLSEGADIRVMSYNVLHPSWSGVTDTVPVSGRDTIVAGIINDYRPDVIGLQEASWEWHYALKEQLVDNGVYKQACNGDEENYIMTTLLYNAKKVKLVDSYVLDLDEGSDIRVVSVAVFEKRSGKAQFVVVNTHPAPPGQGENYFRNCDDILTITADELEKYSDLPFIMTGDFNSGEESDFYQNIMSTLGVTDAKYSADELVNEYGTFLNPCWGGELDPESKHAIDHIFVNDKAKAKLFNVIIDHDVEKASDHIPIYTDIDLK